jgi:hypothetical protein
MPIIELPKNYQVALTPLILVAKEHAPLVIKESISRLITFPLVERISIEENNELEHALEEFFLILFRDQGSNDLQPNPSHRYRDTLPFWYLLSIIDIFLSHGYQIARQSAQTDQAIAAFEKSLTFELVSRYMRELSDCEYLSEMMLLD